MAYLAIGRSSGRLDARCLVYLLLLSIAAAGFLVFPIWRATFYVEIWPTESWNAYWQDAAAIGAPLYPDPKGLLGNNYPPLSFYAVAWIGKLTGIDNLLVGRALSLTAVVAIAVEIFAAVRLLGAGRVAASVGALWYVAIMARNSTVYVGANDQQLAGLAIMGAGLVCFLSLRQHQRSPTPALLLMVVAGFWKHNNIAIPLTAITWLFFERSRFAGRSAAISALACAAGLFACVVIHGYDFLSNLLADRSYGFSNVMTNIGHLQWSALALLIWALWAWRDRSSAAQFTALHIGFGLFACLAQWLGHAIYGNAEFDFILALGIGIGVAFGHLETSWLAEKIGVDRGRDLMIAALLIRLFAADRQETVLLLANDDVKAAFRNAESRTFREAEKVAAIEGDVSCATKLVCRLAGKAFVVDEFKTGELIKTGKKTQAQISEALAARNIFVHSEEIAPNPTMSISAWLRTGR